MPVDPWARFRQPRLRDEGHGECVYVGPECAKCGSTAGCKCWVRLRCEVCGVTKLDERIPEYGDLDEIVCRCPKHR